MNTHDKPLLVIWIVIHIAESINGTRRVMLTSMPPEVDEQSQTLRITVTSSPTGWTLISQVSLQADLKHSGLVVPNVRGAIKNINVATPHQYTCTNW